MRKLLINSAIIVSCLMNTSFANAHSYTSIRTLGKFPVVEAKGTGMLDLTHFVQTNPHSMFAIRNPKTGEISYTRNAYFYNKNDGYYYQNGWRLQGYPVQTDITSTDCKLMDIKAPPEEIPATATTTVMNLLNLNASDSLPPHGAFNPSDPASYNYTTATAIYDSLGAKHLLSTYYIKSAANSWNTAISVDRTVVGHGNLTFNSNGQLSSATGMNALSFELDNGAASPQKINLQFTGATQFASPDYSYPMEHDGMDVGIYMAYMLDDNGYLSYLYNNGQSITFSKIAVFTK